MPKKVLDTIVRGHRPVTPIKTVAGPAIHKTLKKTKKSFWPKINHRLTKRLKKLSLIVIFLLVIGVVGGLAFQKVIDLYRLTKPGKYLILFQNNAELRGGGGFLGSFAVVDLKERKIKRYYFEANIYKKDNDFTATTKITPPSYFSEEFGPNFSLGLRDSNFAADFSQAAANVSHFYGLEYHEEVDGVVALDASLLQNLLKVTGPVTVPGQNARVTADNFFDVVQEQVDKNYFFDQTNRDINEPKSILKDMVTPILAKVKRVSLITLYRFFNEQTAQKHLLFWFKDDRQKLVEKRQWAGRVKATPGEIIFVSNNNIGGDKSSLSVEQTLSLSGTSRNAPGRSLTITRRHTGGTTYAANRDNKNYLKVFLPLGSQVNQVIKERTTLGEGDFTLSQEAGDLVVGLWVTTLTGQTTQVKVEYTLPSDRLGKSILYQKQPGVTKDRLQVIFGGSTVFEGQVDRDQLL